jgi:hypothetical protein
MNLNVGFMFNLALELLILNSLFFLKLFFAQTNSFFSLSTFIFISVNSFNHLGVLSENLNFILTFTSQDSSSIRNQLLDVCDSDVQLIFIGACVVRNLISKFVLDLSTVLSIAESSKLLDFF